MTNPAPAATDLEAPRITWELIYTPAEPGETHGRTFLYRSVRAGVCAPFTDEYPAADELDAEALGLKHGLRRSSEWRDTDSGYRVADATPCA